MSTDLTTVRDHPATLLRKVAEDVVTMSATRRHGMKDAAEVLDLHENLNGVTFAALDNDALAAVREAYAEFLTGEGDYQYIGGGPLADAVRDLLGLADQ